MRLEELPAFCVESISTESDDSRLIGRFTHLRGVQECRSWLYAGYDSLIGDLVELDGPKLAAVFIAPFWTEQHPVRVGSVVPWVDGRWQAYHVKMITDPDAGWHRVTFVASDAQHFRHGNAHGWTRLGARLSEGAVPTFVDRGGWDHEECELCYTHIGRGGRPYGYVDRENHWLCTACYERYAASRNLDFVMTV